MGGGRDLTYQVLTLKLIGIENGAAIKINSCDANKFVRAFEEMSDYIGTNMDGVGYYVQQAPTTGEHHPFANEAPHGPRVELATTQRGIEEISGVKALTWEVMGLNVRGKGHMVMVQKHETGCKKAHL